MAYQTIAASPISGALGAVIEGVDLSRNLDNQTASDLHQALLDRKSTRLNSSHIPLSRMPSSA